MIALGTLKQRGRQIMVSELLTFAKLYEKHDKEIRQCGHTSITKFDEVHDYYVNKVKPFIQPVGEAK